MQLEFLKEMNQLHSLDDELFYNDIDFDSFQTNQDRNAEILFDFADCNRSIDQDLMNALYQVKADHLPDELLNVTTKELSVIPTTSESTIPDSVAVSECATIFESDVDLEASTNLAMNLNQLIGENSVQYVSTEDDDTFIISLDSGIDAEKLSDLLNMGVEMMENNAADTENNTSENNEAPETEPIVITIEHSEMSETNQTITDKPVTIEHSETSGIKQNKRDSPVEEQNKNTKEKIVETNKRAKEKMVAKSKDLFVCKTCKKEFKKRDNYLSHLGKQSSFVE